MSPTSLVFDDLRTKSFQLFPRWTAPAYVLPRLEHVSAHLTLTRLTKFRCLEQGKSASVLGYLGRPPPLHHHRRPRRHRLHLRLRRQREPLLLRRVPGPQGGEGRSLGAGPGSTGRE